MSVHFLAHSPETPVAPNEKKHDGTRLLHLCRVATSPGEDFRERLFDDFDKSKAEITRPSKNFTLLILVFNGVHFRGDELSAVSRERKSFPVEVVLLRDLEDRGVVYY